jgi:hypothetical protein
MEYLQMIIVLGVLFLLAIIGCLQPRIDEGSEGIRRPAERRLERRAALEGEQ